MRPEFGRVYGTAFARGQLVIPAGIVLRLNPDDTIPVDNPFAIGGSSSRTGDPGIWSYGQRNARGKILKPETGDIRRLELRGNEVVHQEVLLQGRLGRIRDVSIGPPTDSFICSLMRMMGLYTGLNRQINNYLQSRQFVGCAHIGGGDPRRASALVNISV